ncbi:MAG: hypothetical protein ACW960_10100 [Candidatus Thorarchaeota archaeon]|jgi:hypothetical protein
MVNKEKASKRDLIRIRKSQNPEQIDFRRMRKHRKARTEFWAFKKKPSAQVVTTKKEKAKPKKKAPKKKRKEPELEVIEDKPELEVVDQEPELEVIEEDEEEPELEVIKEDEKEPELEVIDEELEDLYSYDDDILDDDELEKLEE